MSAMLTAVSSDSIRERCEAFHSLARHIHPNPLVYGVVLSALRDSVPTVRQVAVELLEGWELRWGSTSSESAELRECLVLAERLCAEGPLPGRPYRFGAAIRGRNGAAPSWTMSDTADCLGAADPNIRGAMLSAFSAASSFPVAARRELRRIAVADPVAELRCAALGLLFRDGTQDSDPWMVPVSMIALRDLDTRVLNETVRLLHESHASHPLLAAALVREVALRDDPNAAERLSSLIAQRDPEGRVLLPAVAQTLRHPSARSPRLLPCLGHWLAQHPDRLDIALAQKLLMFVANAVFDSNLSLLSRTPRVGELVELLAERVAKSKKAQAEVLGALDTRWLHSSRVFLDSERALYKILINSFFFGGHKDRFRDLPALSVLKRLLSVPDKPTLQVLARALYDMDPIGRVVLPYLLDVGCEVASDTRARSGALFVLAQYTTPDYPGGYLDIIARAARTQLPSLHRLLPSQGEERGLVGSILAHVRQVRVPLPFSRPNDGKATSL